MNGFINYYSQDLLVCGYIEIPAPARMRLRI